jgi:hypothetical protein
MVIHPEGGNRGRRARMRAIRARMAETGEPYTLAARHHDAEHRPAPVWIMPEARCPRCSMGVLVLDEEQPQCTHCAAVWENGSSAANEYAGTVLRLDWYTYVTGGDERPAEECPECGETAVVWDTFHPDDGRTGLCFGCGESFTTHCAICNRPLFDGDPGGSGPCTECWEDYMQRD